MLTLCGTLSIASIPITWRVDSSVFNHYNDAFLGTGSCTGQFGKENTDTDLDWGAVPDIDHVNPQVQKDLSEWMNWLKTKIGFGGWRFNLILGYAPRFTKIYMDNNKPDLAVEEFFLKLNNKPDGKLDYDQYKNDLVHWVQRVVTTFDFTTKGILGTVVGDTRFYLLKDSKGNPPGMIGLLPQNAVTFIDNHDTYSQQQWPFPTNPNDKATQGYAYIITNSGIPSVVQTHGLPIIPSSYRFSAVRVSGESF
ncbi:Alpha-amylase [Capsicum baccatum]|uniref:1,4-alpha-D-glucan glucanohydrolase n=1 Tax=Capsicum baccatum TaxID=33114 RepID=A0A2G2X6Y4_CAPBA|nr:Alpha-amylase [Capsicum baccatum]